MTIALAATIDGDKFEPTVVAWLAKFRELGSHAPWPTSFTVIDPAAAATTRIHQQSNNGRAK